MRLSQFEQRGFTLIEMLTVLVILMILGGVFYTVFVTNWSAFEDRIARTNLWQEANEIIETMTADGRFAQTIDVFSDGSGNKSAVLNDSFNQPVATYLITSDGRFQINKNGVIKTLSGHINPGQSVFTKQGRGLRVELGLEDVIFKRTINVDTSTEIFPRN
ncbi:MAG: type II secretion system protein [Candidatus Omnitrophota bacterium]